MDILLKWALMASVQLAATMSPGPAFVVCVRNALTHGRAVGVFTALGLALGVGAHVLFVLLGIALIISQSVFLFNLIKYMGAAYLCYIGVKSILFSKKRDASDDMQGEQAGITAVKSNVKSMRFDKAVLNGFLTNLLNPKAVVFFTAVFTQFIGPDTSHIVHVVYGMTSVIIEFLWFSGVSIVLTNARVKRKFMAVMHWVERTCGGLMVGLGVKLALSK